MNRFRNRYTSTHGSSHKRLLVEIRGLIAAARERTAQVVNTSLVALYWAIGRRIRQDVLKKERAGYGERIVSALGRQLSREYGQGFSEKALRHMMRFAEAFPNARIVSALGRQLGWTHFRRIIYLKDPLQRDFYAEMCRVGRWSTRTLDQKVNSMLFERTALSRKPAKQARWELKSLSREDRLTPDLVFLLRTMPGKSREGCTGNEHGSIILMPRVFDNIEATLLS